MQASKVAAWYGRWPGEQEWPVFGALIVNRSDRPVYDICYYFRVGVDPAGGLDCLRFSPPKLIVLIPPQGRRRRRFPSASGSRRKRTPASRGG